MNEMNKIVLVCMARNLYICVIRCFFVEGNNPLICVFIFMLTCRTGGTQFGLCRPGICGLMGCRLFVGKMVAMGILLSRIV